MAPHTNSATPVQIDVLLDFLNEHRDLARGKLRSIEGKVQAKRLWNQLCNMLNSMGGCIKTVQQWQKVWSDRKHLAKKAAAESRRSTSATGGGKSTTPTLSQWERKVLSITGDGFGDRQTRSRVPGFSEIYKGLDVVTAKASVQERETARHHLLDIIEPHQFFTVVDFRNRALKIIDNLIEQGKIPIIVGGTNYYIESIVYNILVEDMDDEEVLLWDKSRRKRDLVDKNEVVASKKQAIDASIAETSEQSKKETALDKEKLKEDLDNEKNFTNEEIHAKLKIIDPVMASRLHPNNKRKVLRSIEVWLKSGRLHSEILAEQKLSEGKLRRPNSTIILWLKCEQSVHDERLNARVDKMLEDGLIDELIDFHARHNKQRIHDGNPPDYTKGVFQTLGFKEFHDYLMLSPEERDTEQGKKLLQVSIENMKTGTRRFARRQNKMVRSRFLNHPTREIPPIYELDTTDLSKWDENVKSKAIYIIESFINKATCDFEPLKPNLTEEKKNIDGNSHNYCEVCQRIFLGDHVYAIHLKSNRHEKVLKLKKKLSQTKDD